MNIEEAREVSRDNIKWRGLVKSVGRRRCGIRKPLLTPKGNSVKSDDDDDCNAKLSPILIYYSCITINQVYISDQINVFFLNIFQEQD